MPLFSRSDGDLIRDVAPVRAIMPYLMPGRTESFVLHEMTVDLTRTLPALAAFNAARGPAAKATLFQFVLHALAATLHEKPGLNRFVVGGRFYQRRGVWLSFAAKKSMDVGAPLLTVKLDFRAEAPFAETVARVGGEVGESRTGPPRAVDTETRVLTSLPGFLLRFIVGAGRLLNRFNLMPRAMIATDPMFASCFVANLGSVGIDRTYHHCFEWGTAHLFCVVGRVKKHVFIEGETPVVRDAVQLFFTFDERANDGLYCMKALERLRERLEAADGLWPTPQAAGGARPGATGP